VKSPGQARGLKPLAGQLVCAAVIPLWSHGDPAVVFFKPLAGMPVSPLKKRVASKF